MDFTSFHDPAFLNHIYFLMEYYILHTVVSVVLLINVIKAGRSYSSGIFLSELL